MAVHLHQEGPRFDPTSHRWLREVVDRELSHLHDTSWECAPESLADALPAEMNILSQRSDDFSEDLLAGLPDGRGVAYLELYPRHLRVRVAAHDTATIETALKWLRDAFPRKEKYEHGRVPVRFWFTSDHGPSHRTRVLDVPTWDAIRNNYSEQLTRPALDKLVADFEPFVAGQLLLWHGEPGTGKTYALRTLAWEWREWCDLHYIVDPERIFGDRSRDLIEIAQSSTIDRPVERSAAERPRWHLLVLEDTGEMLALDAKARVGQALSRLLNLVDGLLGQGLRLMVLVTTNEPLTALHPALTRPGRCAGEIEFTPLSADEAARWCDANGLPRPRRAMTLAELHALRDGRRLETSQRPVGFVA